MVRAMCGAKLMEKKRTQDLMEMLGLKETAVQMAKANGVRWYGHVLRREEDLNVITALKCNKLLSVITFGLKCNKLLSVTTFGLKCNNVIPTSSVTLLTCCWLLVVISCVIGHIIKKLSDQVFSGLSRD